MTTARTAHAIFPAIEEPQPSPSASVEPARFSFRQPVSTAGYVDAAWWPRSLDLTVELPPLLDALWTAGREINRVTYSLRAWVPAPRRIEVDGRTIRLGGFTTSDALMVRLSDAWGRERIDILVVPPSTDPAAAQRALLISAREDSHTRAAEILTEARADVSPRP